MKWINNHPSVFILSFCTYRQATKFPTMLSNLAKNRTLDRQDMPNKHRSSVRNKPASSWKKDMDKVAYFNATREIIEVEKGNNG